jgi:hypothetical protein
MKTHAFGRDDVRLLLSVVSVEIRRWLLLSVVSVEMRRRFAL